MSRPINRLFVQINSGKKKHLHTRKLRCFLAHLVNFANSSTINCEASQTVKMSADNLDSLLKEPMDIAKVHQASTSRFANVFSRIYNREI
jgi:hypothetical protein